MECISHRFLFFLSIISEINNINKEMTTSLKYNGLKKTAQHIAQAM